MGYNWTNFYVDCSGSFDRFVAYAARGVVHVFQEGVTLHQSKCVASAFFNVVECSGCHSEAILIEAESFP